jgi:nucleotide-binding universal stress UspA family protein
MKTFLVPVDFSAVTDKVIEAALGFARAFQGRVTLLHIIQPPVVAGGEYTLPAEVMEETVNHHRRIAEARLAGRQELFRQAGVECAADTAVGAPVPLILGTAARTGADYVIMGSHGQGKLYDLLVGSTASGVLKKAGCGVIVIPPADKGT